MSYLLPLSLFIQWFVFISVISFLMAMIAPILRCKIGIHFLPLYPHKVREIGSYTSYEHYKCYRCGKEIIK